MNANISYDKEYFPKQVRFDTPSKSDPRLQSYSDPRLLTYTDARHQVHPPTYARQHSIASLKHQSIERTRSNSDSPCPRPAAYQQLHLSTDKLAYNYGNENNFRKNTNPENNLPKVFSNYYANNQYFPDPMKSPNLSQVSDEINCNLGYETQTQRLNNNYGSKVPPDPSEFTPKHRITTKKDLHHPAPSNELDLSILDSENGFRSNNMLNKHVSKTQSVTSTNVEKGDHTNTSIYTCEYNEMPHPFPPQKNISELGSPHIRGTDQILSNKPITNLTQSTRPDSPDKTAGFFFKPGQDIKNPLTLPNLRKDNELVLKSKMEIANVPTVLKDNTNLLPTPNFHIKQRYACNFTKMQSRLRNSTKENIYPAQYGIGQHNNCSCMPDVPNCQVYRNIPVQNQPYHLCCNDYKSHECNIPKTPMCSRRKNICSDTIATKTKAIEQRESQQNENTLDNQDNELGLKKTDKAEPTVSDLCEIIKLQNEQLQLLQERVDKLVTLNEDKIKPVSSNTHFPPIEQMTVETINDNIQKISIGVMTSFEMVRTSHSIIKGHNIQHIQCSQSQISVTKVGEPANFLDGITRCNKNTDLVDDRGNQSKEKESAYDKTLNDLSLYPPQIQEVMSPDVSPETSLHLDVQDYSDSDEGNSNVGWTYYNQVMNHVNEILGSSQDNSNTPQKTPSAAKPPFSVARPVFSAVKPAIASRLMGAANISVSTSKRVTFGDCQETSPQDMNQRTASTETSFQMNRLAMKYLQGRSEPKTNRPQPAVATHFLNDMSLATRQYMQQHRLIQGVSPEPMSRFPNKILDITALKQQPKLL